MAETLTFENNVETTTVENLNADEQDSLQVGEELQAQQDQLLAGKYKDAQELEKAYVELSKKLGEDKGEASTEDQPEAEADTEAKDEKKEDEPAESNILDKLWDEATSGEKYSKETLDQLKGMDPGDLATMHLQYRQNAEKNRPQQQEMSQEDVTQIKAIAGGDKEYSNMLQWAQQNLNEQEVNMFDAVMERGDPLAAFFAVRSLAYRYEDARGVEGKMVTGKPPTSSGDVFRSQAEVVKAMSDPRYDKDHAYRLDIQEKLERSDINF